MRVGPASLLVQHVQGGTQDALRRQPGQAGRERAALRDVLVGQRLQQRRHQPRVLRRRLQQRQAGGRAHGRRPVARQALQQGLHAGGVAARRQGGGGCPAHARRRVFQRRAQQRLEARLARQAHGIAADGGRRVLQQARHQRGGLAGLRGGGHRVHRAPPRAEVRAEQVAHEVRVLAHVAGAQVQPQAGEERIGIAPGQGLLRPRAHPHLELGQAHAAAQRLEVGDEQARIAAPARHQVRGRGRPRRGSEQHHGGAPRTRRARRQPLGEHLGGCGAGLHHVQPRALAGCAQPGVHPAHALGARLGGGAALGRRDGPRQPLQLGRPAALAELVQHALRGAAALIAVQQVHVAHQRLHLERGQARTRRPPPERGQAAAGILRQAQLGPQAVGLARARVVPAQALEPARGFEGVAPRSRLHPHAQHVQRARVAQAPGRVLGQAAQRRARRVQVAFAQRGRGRQHGHLLLHALRRTLGQRGQEAGAARLRQRHLGRLQAPVGRGVHLGQLRVQRAPRLAPGRGRHPEQPPERVLRRVAVQRSAQEAPHEVRPSALQEQQQHGEAGAGGDPRIGGVHARGGRTARQHVVPDQLLHARLSGPAGGRPQRRGEPGRHGAARARRGHLQRGHRQAACEHLVRVVAARGQALQVDGERRRAHPVHDARAHLDVARLVAQRRQQQVGERVLEPQAQQQLEAVERAPGMHGPCGQQLLHPRIVGVQAGLHARPGRRVGQAAREPRALARAEQRGQQAEQQRAPQTEGGGDAHDRASLAPRVHVRVMGPLSRRAAPAGSGASRSARIAATPAAPAASTSATLAGSTPPSATTGRRTDAR